MNLRISLPTPLTRSLETLVIGKYSISYTVMWSCVVSWIRSHKGFFSQTARYRVIEKTWGFPVVAHFHNKFGNTRWDLWKPCDIALFWYLALDPEIKLHARGLKNPALDHEGKKIVSNYELRIYEWSQRCSGPISTLLIRKVGQDNSTAFTQVFCTFSLTMAILYGFRSYWATPLHNFNILKYLTFWYCKNPKRNLT